MYLLILRWDKMAISLNPRLSTPIWVCVCSVAQACPSLGDPLDCSQPGSSAHGIFQARILEWVAISSSRSSSWPRDRTCVSCVSCAGRSFTTELAGKPHSKPWPWNKTLISQIVKFATWKKEMPPMRQHNKFKFERANILFPQSQPLCFLRGKLFFTVVVLGIWLKEDAG